MKKNKSLLHSHSYLDVLYKGSYFMRVFVNLELKKKKKVCISLMPRLTSSFWLRQLLVVAHGIFHCGAQIL